MKWKYFLPYQSAWVLDCSHLKICEKSRQIGLSYADSYDSVRKAAARGGRNVWVMSRDEAQAKQYIRYCKNWASILKHAAHELGEQLFTDRTGKAVQVQVLSFASGASIYALSSNPDAIVGKSGHVKLDEFALHREQRTLYAVAKPVTQWGGTLSIISTHRGIGSLFYELLEDVKQGGNPMGWSLHTIPIHRAVEEGLVERINKKTGRTDSRGEWLQRQRAECIDEEQWLQEYCCVPADESSAFITFEMLHGCEEPELALMSIEQLEEYCAARRRSRSAAPIGQPLALYLGMDVARKHDLCVLDVGEKIGDVVWDRLRIELSNQSFSELKAQLYRLLRISEIKRCCIDATGLGMQLAEEAKSDFGWKLEPIIFTAPVKEELAFGLRTALQERKVRLVPDEKLRADLRGVKKEVGLSGNIRFLGETQDSHCDRFWAKALRQYAARGQNEVWAMVA